MNEIQAADNRGSKGAGEMPVSGFEHEIPYLVIKLKDADGHLTTAEKELLQALATKMARGRTDAILVALRCAVA